ncbi:hypothetical protein X971_5101 (plasmid) [Agrobacterium tumefaciens LBA4213 (Ach5)]|nr:hypothetical protein X971_5101 [Agrobacterium tumefaciens LBA4213 (Ach5)]CUX04930.1 hypothetical protein AGR1C_pAt20030 [Agrobacterium fabacearum TT111]
MDSALVVGKYIQAQKPVSLSARPHLCFINQSTRCTCSLGFLNNANNGDVAAGFISYSIAAWDQMDVSKCSILSG